MSELDVGPAGIASAGTLCKGRMMITDDIERRCLQLSPRGAILLSATIATRFASIAMTSLRERGFHDEPREIGRAIDALWQEVSLRQDHSGQVRATLETIEELGDLLAEWEDYPGIRFHASLEVLGAAFECYLNPSPDAAAATSSLAIDMIFQWLEFDFDREEILDPERVTIEDRRFKREIQWQERVLLLIEHPQSDGNLLLPNVLGDLRSDCIEQAAIYRRWMASILQ